MVLPFFWLFQMYRCTQWVRKVLSCNPWLVGFPLGPVDSFIICLKSKSKIFTFLSATEEKPMSRPFGNVEKVTTCPKAKLKNQFSLHPCVHHFVLVQSSIIEWLSRKNPLWFYVLYKGAINFCILLYILKSYPKKMVRIFIFYFPYALLYYVD